VTTGSYLPTFDSKKLKIPLLEPSYFQIGGGDGCARLGEEVILRVQETIRYKLQLYARWDLRTSTFVRPLVMTSLG
jgi:hypothetical protein